MSLFRTVGEKFEETKRNLLGEGNAEFVCQACDKAVTQQYDECPHCREDAIEPVS